MIQTVCESSRRKPEAFGPLLSLDRFTWTGPAPLPALPWFPNPLGDGFHLSDMVGALPLPEAFRWARTFHLQGCTGLGQLHLDGGTLLRIEDCPGLLSLRVDGAVERIEIKRCPDLKSVRLAQVGPPSARFSKLPNLRFNQENMQIEFPSPKARSAFADQGPGLRLEDCPALTSLRMGAGDLGMRKFGKMESRSQPSWVWSMMVERKS